MQNNGIQPVNIKEKTTYKKTKQKTTTTLRPCSSHRSFHFSIHSTQSSFGIAISQLNFTLVYGLKCIPFEQRFQLWKRAASKIQTVRVVTDLNNMIFCQRTLKENATVTHYTSSHNSASMGEYFCICAVKSFLFSYIKDELRVGRTDFATGNVFAYQIFFLFNNNNTE